MVAMLVAGIVEVEKARVSLDCRFVMKTMYQLPCVILEKCPTKFIATKSSKQTDGKSCDSNRWRYVW